jgi:hypothetical protein
MRPADLYPTLRQRGDRQPAAPIPASYAHTTVWTGTQMLIRGGYPVRRTDPERPFTHGAAYTPSPL